MQVFFEKEIGKVFQSFLDFWTSVRREAAEEGIESLQAPVMSRSPKADRSCNYYQTMRTSQAQKGHLVKNRGIALKMHIRRALMRCSLFRCFSLSSVLTLRT